MSTENVRVALDTILNAWSAAENIPVAWENLATGSELSAPYVEAFLLPAETTTVGVAISDNQDYTGIYQISVRTEKGKGTLESRTIVNSLLTAFARGVESTIDQQRVLVQSTSVAPFIDSEAWYTVPVSVTYRSFA